MALQNELKAKMSERYGASVGLYSDLMIEIKRRMQGIKNVLNGVWQMDTRMGEEFCNMNFRVICELIAVGSLVAHGDIWRANSRGLGAKYTADQVVSAARRLHSDFYPKPGVSGPGAEESFLTRDDLIYLYRMTGKSGLGSVAKLPEVMQRQPSLTKTLQWHWKVVRLLNVHRIALIDPYVELWVKMDIASHEGFPTVDISLLPGHPWLQNA